MIGGIEGFHCKVHELAIYLFGCWLKGGETFTLNVLATLDALNPSQARCMRGTNCFATKLYLAVPSGGLQGKAGKRETHISLYLILGEVIFYWSFICSSARHSVACHPKIQST